MTGLEMMWKREVVAPWEWRNLLKASVKIVVFGLEPRTLYYYYYYFIIIIIIIRLANRSMKNPVTQLFLYSLKLCKWSFHGNETQRHAPHKYLDTITRDFRLPPRRSWGLRCSTKLRALRWWLVTDASGQHIGPIFTGQRVQEEISKQVPTYADQHSRRAKDSITIMFQLWYQSWMSRWAGLYRHSRGATCSKTP